MLLRCRRRLMWKWTGAPSCCNHIVCCIVKGTFSINGGSMFCRKARYVSLFRRCGSTTGPSRRSPIISAHTLMLMRFFNHSVRIVCSPQMTTMQVNDAIMTKVHFVGDEDQRQKSHNGDGPVAQTSNRIFPMEENLPVIILAHVGGDKDNSSCNVGYR